MNYLRAFLKANAKQLLTSVLSAADLIILLKHPHWVVYTGIAGVLLASWGIHLDPMAYSPEAINKRLGL